MDRDVGPDSVPQASTLDKSKILNVRPLRCLVPVFPSPLGLTTFSPPQVPPFVCAPPFGPYPPGFAPFYPFFMPPDAQRPPEQQPHVPTGATGQASMFGFSPAMQTPTPVPLFRTPPPPAPTQFAGAVNGDSGPLKKSSKIREEVTPIQPQSVNRSDSVRSATEENGCSDYQKWPSHHFSSYNVDGTDAEATSNAARPQIRSHKRTKNIQDIRLSFPDGGLNLSDGNILMTFDALRRADGDRESVCYILLTFDALRRRITQIEEAKEAMPGVTRRPDLKAGTFMMNKGIRTNTKKRIGLVPGVEIGDIFFFRMEMCLVGLHAPCMAGIDYTSLKVNQEEEPVAVSIVSSGGYEDDVEAGDVLIYSGQGGNIYRKDKQVEDQKLERGNLALERSLRRGNEVRVIRGMKDLGNPTGKVYVYDGLYRIHESWTERGKSGCNVFKYKLIRVPGQPEAFTMWKSIQQWKEGVTSRTGVILPDLTSGAENLPVSLVNDIDDERGPAHFTYYPGLKYSKPANSIESSFGCDCQSACRPSDPNCSCNQKNTGSFPYTVTGVLVTRRSLIYECGSSCKCSHNCRNRVSQAGLKVRLEVFKTKDRGWGLRSLDPIRAGGFICEYAGEVIEKVKIEEYREEDDDEYIFDTSRTYDNSFNWNYIPELLGEESKGDSNEACSNQSPLVISAKTVGNVSRFMNHSCYPNAFWQPVLRENSHESHVHIVFYAIKHIPPMTELTYDYGFVESDRNQKKKCLCGSSKCRGYFG